MGDKHIPVNPWYKGATSLELARLFDRPTSTVRDALVGVIPSGKRGNVDVYMIKDAAAALSPTQTDAETVRKILKANHSSLPTELAKEFWQAETARQRFLREDGDLWPTAKVVEWMGDTFKSIRLSLLLMSDAVDREEALTRKQRDVLIALIDATLNDTADKLVSEFANRAIDDNSDGREPASHEADAPGQDEDTEEL